MSFTGKIKRNQGAIIHWVVVVGIAATMAAVIMLVIGVEKKTYEADATRYEQSFMTHGAGIDENDKRLDAIEKQGPLATEADIVVAMNQSATNTANITALDGRLTNAECNVTAIRDELACVSGSPPEGYLTGGFGNYTLYAKASDAGNFAADVILAYSTPIVVGNTTYDDAALAFYGSVNLTAPSVRYYEPSLIYTGTKWAVRKVMFNIGTFALNATIEKSIAVVFSGLNSTYTPSYAYVYVVPVLE